MRITAIILSAGFSSRMGAFKPILKLGKRTALEHLIEANKEAGIDDIIVVTGHNRDLLTQIIEKNNAIEAYNPDFEQGMFSSLLTGMSMALKRAKPEGLDGILMFPVDVPLVSSKTISQVVASYKEGYFSVATYKGKKGHPLLIPAAFISGIMEHSGERGLKGFTQFHQDKFIRVEAEEEAILLDMDTPCDYDEILKCVQDSAKSESIELKQRVFLVRHGSTEQHKDKIFMGQVDVPLSHKGQSEIRKSAQRLKAMGVSKDSIGKIYSSDLVRAWESATIIKDSLYPQGDIPIEKISEFREMNLGDWDGKYIEDIKRDFPKEYEKRGEDILFYKPPNAENYYDMTYRVQKKVKEILVQEEKDPANKGKDIIIVAHKGVISAIMALVEKLSPNQAWKLRIERASVHQIDKGTWLSD